MKMCTIIMKMCMIIIHDDHESRFISHCPLYYCCYLDLLNYRIERGGIRCVQLSGSMNIGDLQNLIPTYPYSNDVMMIMMIINYCRTTWPDNPSLQIQSRHQSYVDLPQSRYLYPMHIYLYSTSCIIYIFLCNCLPMKINHKCL